MSSKVLLLLLIFATVFLASLSAAGVTEADKKEIDRNFIKLHENYDYLAEKVAKLEENQLPTNFANDWNEMKTIMKKLLKSSEKIPEMRKLLSELKETVQEQKKNKRDTKDDILKAMTSQCTSFCESKVNIWANESSSKFKGDLDNFDFTLNNSPFNSSSTCHPNPCANGGQCERTTYHCTNCPFLTSGRHCENVNCNKANKCFQYHSNIYVVFEENVVWATAYNICSRVGMRLAHLKDRDTSEAVVSQLKITYVPTRNFHFWLGLRTNGSEWVWADGSPLGTYTGAMVNFKANLGERWGLIYLSNLAGITWYPRAPAEVAKWVHYPLCEKRIYARY